MTATNRRASTAPRFEHEGVWWDTRNPDERWVGVLRFDRDNGATLTLIVPSTSAKSLGRVETYQVILGLTPTGIAITLMGCLEQSMSFAFGSAPGRRQIFANRVIVGAHTEEPDPLVSSMSVTFAHLNEWWAPLGIERDATVEPPDLLVRYAARTPVVVHDDGVLRVSIRSGLTGSVGRHEVATREETSFDIDAITPRRLSEFDRCMQACGDFLTIACLTLCHIEERAIVFPSAAPGERAQRGTFHAIPVYTKPDRRSSVLVHMLLRSADISTRTRETISSWLSMADTLGDVRALYLVGVYGEGFLETKLLALTQALEALHRRLYSGVYMEDPKEFVTQVFEPMKAAIPSSIGGAHRDAITSRLRFANEFSQAKRIEVLFSEHAETLRVLVAEPNTWVRPIIDHRNAFTHFDPDNRPPAGHERVLLYNWLLRLLLEACFLKVMGITHKEIAAMAKRSEMYRQIAARFFRHETP